jgi:membrane protein required for colicin V production
MEPQTAFNNLDYIVLGVILLSGFLALMRGFVRELFSLVAWAGAYFAATKFYTPALPMVHHYVKNDQAAEWVAIGCVFVVALIVLMIVGNAACGLIKGRAMTSVDCSLGLLYGLARGALVVSLVYLCAVMIFWPNIDTSDNGQQQTTDKDPNPPPELLLHAKTRPLLAYGADLLRDFVPKDMIDKTLKGAEAQKAAMEKSARDKALGESPNAAAPDADSNGPVDTDKLFNQGSKP